MIFRVSEAEPEMLDPVGLQELGYWERRDLQRWIEEHPEIVGPGLLLVTTEFDRWQFGERRVADCLDLLFLTTDGAPLVAELKRGAKAAGQVSGRRPSERLSDGIAQKVRLPGTDMSFTGSKMIDLAAT